MLGLIYHYEPIEKRNELVCEGGYNDLLCSFNSQISQSILSLFLLTIGKKLEGFGVKGDPVASGEA